MWIKEKSMIEQLREKRRSKNDLKGNSYISSFIHFRVYIRTVGFQHLGIAVQQVELVQQCDNCCISLKEQKIRRTEIL